MFVNQLIHGGIRALIDYDSTIFDDLVLPDGVDAQAVVDHIIMKYGDAPLYAPDAAVIKYYIKEWSTRRLALWERYKDAAEAQYNPLENYDREEDVTTDYTPGAAYENLISADNSTGYQADRKTQPVGSGYDRTVIDGRIHGNIGVTTSQQMLASEFDIIPRLDLIDFIADDWHSEFCLMMYNE